MPSPEVKCEVNTCTHWLPGGYCSAANIDILNQIQGEMPESAHNTECKTFKERRGITDMISSIDNVNWSGIAVGMFLDGQQVTPSVTCTVESCIYWDNGNLCSVDGIQVSGHEARTCQETNCHTFKSK